MTQRQINNYNRMLQTLKKISKGYQTPDQLRRNSEKQYGLDYEDALEMSYENIQTDASNCIHGLQKIKVNSKQ